MTDEARRHGKLTAAHCTSAQGVQNCLDAGVDMIIHCIFNEPDGSYRYRPDLVERLVAAKAWVNPTLYVQKAGIDRQRAVREARGPADARSSSVELDVARRALDAKFAAVGRMIEAGVRMTAGSDSPWGWYAPANSSTRSTCWPRRDFLATRSSPARRRRRLDRRGPLAGRLAPGRPADVLVVRATPHGRSPRCGTCLTSSRPAAASRAAAGRGRLDSMAEGRPRRQGEVEPDAVCPRGIRVSRRVGCGIVPPAR